MDLSQYTPDAICRSMGLGGFIENDWSAPTLRLLLKPSFHPEVCITLTCDARLVVVALSEMLWHKPTPVSLTAWREEVSVDERIVARTLADAVRAIEPFKSQWISIDGMSAVGCIQTATALQQVAASASAPSAFADFVTDVSRMSWEQCRDVRVRNALAHCAAYVGLDLPVQDEPQFPTQTGLAILGDPEACADLSSRLKDREVRGPYPVPAIEHPVPGTHSAITAGMA